MTRKTELLSLLRGSKDYLSRQEICDRFGVSRTAIWKIINQLKKDGYQIEAVQNRGYRLISAPDTLSQAELECRMMTNWAGKNLYFSKETGSTNTDLKVLAEENAPQGTLVVADSQTAGKGRRGRTWASPPGSAVYMSLLLRPQIPAEKASMLTIVMALAVARAIQGILPNQTGEQVTSPFVQIKWPNDIILNKKKVCGILTEMSMEASDISYVVIGVGINVNQTTFPEEIKETASSLFLQTGTHCDRCELVSAIMREFETLYENFLHTGNLADIRDKYEALLVNRNQTVNVLDPKGNFTGIALGINNKGELLVQKENGETEEIYAGEVSVRGIYGYV